MNILFTLTSYPPAIGGAQLHTHEIVRRLAQRDEVRVVNQWSEHRTDWLLGTTLNAPRVAKPYELNGVPVQPITLSIRERLALLPYVLGYYAIKPLAIDRIADVLAPKIAARATAVDVVHNARVGREGLSYASLRVARQRDVPFVFVPYHHPRWVGWNYRAFLALYREADAVIALTEAERRTLVTLEVCEERIFVTGIGPIVAPTADGGRARYAFGLGHDPVVLFLGQMYAYKGLDALLRATELVWQRHPDTRFVFVGPRTAFSRRRFAGLDDPRIVELGKVSLQEKSDLLATCTLLCVPSTQESFGGVYTEGWVMGKPVIGGDIPAIRDVIDEGEDGFLVPQEAAVIAERLLYLLDHPTEAAAMGERGRQKVLARYTWDRLAEKTRRVYEAVMR